jgi:hypothetical protein
MNIQVFGVTDQVEDGTLHDLKKGCLITFPCWPGLGSSAHHFSSSCLLDQKPVHTLSCVSCFGAVVFSLPWSGHQFVSVHYSYTLYPCTVLFLHSLTCIWQYGPHYLRFMERTVSLHMSCLFLGTDWPSSGSRVWQSSLQTDVITVILLMPSIGNEWD